MLYYIAKLHYKIQLKLNKVHFISNSNLTYKNKFRLGDQTTFIFKENSKAIFGI